METNRNKKYFEASGVPVLFLVGAAMMLVGIIVLLVKSPIQPVGTFLVIPALYLFVISFSGKAKEDDIDHQIEERIKDIYEDAQKKLEVYDKDFLRIIDPVMLKGYDYNAKENLYFKHGADSRNRTNIYTAVQLFFTNDKVYYYGTHFSLTDDLLNEDIIGSVPYTQLKSASVEQSTYVSPKERHVDYYSFKLTDKDDSDILFFSVAYGADVDKAVEDINHVIGVKQRDAVKEAEKKAEKRAALRSRTAAQTADDIATQLLEEQAKRAAGAN